MFKHLYMSIMCISYTGGTSSHIMHSKIQKASIMLFLSNEFSICHHITLQLSQWELKNNPQYLKLTINNCNNLTCTSYKLYNIILINLHKIEDHFLKTYFHDFNRKAMNIYFSKSFSTNLTNDCNQDKITSQSFHC